MFFKRMIKKNQKQRSVRLKFKNLNASVPKANLLFHLGRHIHPTKYHAVQQIKTDDYDG